MTQLMTTPTIVVDDQPRTLIEMLEPQGAAFEAASATVQATNAWRTGQAGFIGATLHRSDDGGKLLNYVQWASAAELEQAQAAYHEQPVAVQTEAYYVAQIWTHTIASSIALGTPENGVIVIDTIPSPRPKQEQLLDTTLANGARLAQLPGNQAIAVLAGHGGTIITYAHWHSATAFFRAFAALSGTSVHSMPALNQAILEMSGGATRTDYRAYTVVASWLR